MFKNSIFNGDISGWDVSGVQDMTSMFSNSQFNGDLSMWKPLSIISIDLIFNNCKAPIPYWTKIDDVKERENAIDIYHTQKNLNKLMPLKGNKTIIKI